MAENGAFGFRTVQEVAAENRCDDRTVQNWCRENGVPFIGSGRGKRYLIGLEHEEGFRGRPKPGRRWPEKK